MTIFDKKEISTFRSILSQPKPDFLKKLLSKNESYKFSTKKISLKELKKNPQEMVGELFVLYSIEQRKIRTRKGINLIFNERFRIMDNMIKALHLAKPFPDGHFYLYLGDSSDGYLLEDNQYLPLMTFAKKKNRPALLIPDFEVLSKCKALLHHTVKGNEKHPWEKKFPILFWRGSTTGGQYTKENYLNFPRTRAVSASIQSPQLIDAKFTHFCQITKEAKQKMILKGYKGKSASIEEHLKYKYLLLLDGNSCSYSRAFWLFHSNCLVFKEDSLEEQWYYPLFTPWEHYIPLSKDLFDLEEKIKWAMTGDEKAKKITQCKKKFSEEVLTFPVMIQYLYETILQALNYFL